LEESVFRVLQGGNIWAKTKGSQNTAYTNPCIPQLIGASRGSWLPKLLVYLVISCFKRRCPKQNIVARLKSKDLAPRKFWAGYTTASGLSVSPHFARAFLPDYLVVFPSFLCVAIARTNKRVTGDQRS